MPTAPRDAKNTIADALRAKIEAGEYPPGAEVPGENQLAADYGVARMTARSALDVLKAEGLIVARRGSGTRVRTFQPIHRRASQRLDSTVWGGGQSIWSQDTGGRSFTVDAIEVDTAPATAQIARTLGMQPGDAVCVRARRYVLDGRPVMLATSYLSMDLVADTPITQPDTGPGGTYARLADIGHSPVRFTETLRARMPLAKEATHLDLPPGTPVVQVTRTAQDSAGATVEFTEMVADGSAYTFEYEISANPT